ncbi:MAG: hypothetical protein ACD_80C00105G0004 [uncultured bacterium (gcode 4)]|uniref:Uncharacterized protein n=1 Tax=uncultured bacterium (gcode 4) TaxID=1234023 RepID=K1XJ28_9BACT|nr:MAG: hypothetical protein ACD_80C00105G0004 [uncultured bacterium (gcode 4)]
MWNILCTPDFKHWVLIVPCETTMKNKSLCGQLSVDDPILQVIRYSMHAHFSMKHTDCFTRNKNDASTASFLYTILCTFV